MNPVTEPVKITSLELENVKRIRACAITPTQNGLTVIGGRNNQGKTSVLDAIAWALGGDRHRPSRAAREGSSIPPRLCVKLSNGLVVERTGKNSDLKVTDTEGRRAGQQLLNEFVEQLALDLPKFMQASAKEKAGILLEVIGVEDQLTELDRKENSLYNDRLAIGRIADQKAKHAKEITGYPEAPMEPVSAYDLIQRQQDILARNGENQRKRQRAAQLEAQRDSLRRQLDDLQAKYEAVCGDCEIARRDALDLLDESTEELEADIRNVEAINIKVRANQEKARAEEEARDYQNQYDTLTSEIEDIRQKKRDLLLGANLPLPGLSVEDGELVYMGKPWDCMSGSDQLKVSAAIVRAIKPQCGFVLLDKLEQMDPDTLREFGAWMKAEGLQGIATRVSTDGTCSILIEDGYAKEGDGPAPAPAAWKAGEF